MILYKIKRNYEEGGLLQVFERAAKKASYLLYHTNNAYWFRMDLNRGIREFPTDVTISINLDSPTDTIEYIRKHGYYYPEEINVGLGAGHIFASLKLDGKTIGYNKTGFGKIYIADFKRVYEFPPAVAFTYDTYIDRKFRNRNYGALLLSGVCRLLKQKGFRSIWAHIPPWNTASEAMHRKLGFERQKRISYYWVAGIAWTTDDPVRFIELVESRHRTVPMQEC